MAKSALHTKLQHKGAMYLLNKGYWIKTLEMPSPVGIIDVWGISNSNNYETTAIEVKVSRGDYNSRSQKYKEFSSESLANYCYLLCPKGLITEPRHPSWGLMWYDEVTGRLKVVKKPIRFEMSPLGKIHIMVHLFQNTQNNPEKLLYTEEEEQV
jgi:hypothetical protein